MVLICNGLGLLQRDVFLVRHEKYIYLWVEKQMFTVYLWIMLAMVVVGSSLSHDFTLSKKSTRFLVPGIVLLFPREEHTN